MKIIFDNETQRVMMLGLLIESSCPHDYDLHSFEDCDGSNDETKCKRCWERSGLEFEKSKED